MTVEELLARCDIRPTNRVTDEYKEQFLDDTDWHDSRIYAPQRDYNK